MWHRPREGLPSNKGVHPWPEPNPPPRAAAKPASPEHSWPREGPQGLARLAAEGRGQAPGSDVSREASNSSGLGAPRAQPEEEEGPGGGGCLSTRAPLPAGSPLGGGTEEAEGGCLPGRAMHRGSLCERCCPQAWASLAGTAQSCRPAGCGAGAASPSAAACLPPGCRAAAWAGDDTDRGAGAQPPPAPLHRTPSLRPPRAPGCTEQAAARAACGEAAWLLRGCSATSGGAAGLQGGSVAQAGRWQRSGTGGWRLHAAQAGWKDSPGKEGEGPRLAGPGTPAWDPCRPSASRSVSTAPAPGEGWHRCHCCAGSSAAGLGGLCLLGPTLEHSCVPCPAHPRHPSAAQPPAPLTPLVPRARLPPTPPTPGWSMGQPLPGPSAPGAWHPPHPWRAACPPRLSADTGSAAQR